MNKLLFRLEVNFGDNIVFIANNHKDISEYLKENYDWYKFNVEEESVSIQAREGYEKEYATLEWIKHI